MHTHLPPRPHRRSAQCSAPCWAACGVSQDQLACAQLGDLEARATRKWSSAVFWTPQHLPLHLSSQAAFYRGSRSTYRIGKAEKLKKGHVFGNDVAHSWRLVADLLQWGRGLSAAAESFKPVFYHLEPSVMCVGAVTGMMTSCATSICASMTCCACSKAMAAASTGARGAPSDQSQAHTRWGSGKGAGGGFEARVGQRDQRNRGFALGVRPRPTRGRGQGDLRNFSRGPAPHTWKTNNKLSVNPLGLRLPVCFLQPRAWCTPSFCSSRRRRRRSC